MCVQVCVCERESVCERENESVRVCVCWCMSVYSCARTWVRERSERNAVEERMGSERGT